MLKRLVLLPLIVGLVGTAGCLEFEQAATLMPDGSGKLVLTLAFDKEKMEGMAEMGGGTGPLEEIENPDPEELERDSEGIVAWAAIKKEEKGAKVTFTITAYFDDINKVKMWEKEEPKVDEAGEEEGGMGGMEKPKEEKPKKKLMLAFEYKKDANTLIVTNGMRDDLVKPLDDADEGDEEMKKMMVDMMKKLLEGFKFTVSVTVPGDVKDGGGLTKSGRKASYSIDDKTFIDAVEGGADSKKKLQALPAKATVTWEKSTVSDEDQAAFKKELAAAKEKWKTLREEWMKARRKK